MSMPRKLPKHRPPDVVIGGIRKFDFDIKAISNDNRSGITPRGHRVLILPDEVKTHTSSGIQIVSPGALASEEMAQTEGIVVAIGPDCWSDKASKWAEVGDRVIFGKYSGMVCPGNDGLKYRLINDLDIAALKEKANG